MEGAGVGNRVVGEREGKAVGLGVGLIVEGEAVGMIDGVEVGVVVGDEVDSVYYIEILRSHNNKLYSNTLYNLYCSTWIHYSFTVRFQWTHINCKRDVHDK